MHYAFVSYARSDHRKVEVLVRRLQDDRFDIRYDNNPDTSNGDLAENIGGAIREASCVIVVWSSESVQSQWVKAEATLAQSNSVLLPILIETVELPLPFVVVPACDLRNWDGDPTNPEFLTVEDKVLSILGTSQASPFTVCKVKLKRLEQWLGTWASPSPDMGKRLPKPWVSTGDSLFNRSYLEPLRAIEPRTVINYSLRWLATRAIYDHRVPIFIILLTVLRDSLPHEPGPGMTGGEIEENIAYVKRLGVEERVSPQEWVPLLNSVASDCWA